MGVKLVEGLLGGCGIRRVGGEDEKCGLPTHLDLEEVLRRPVDLLEGLLA